MTATANTGARRDTVTRMYVLDGGEAHAQDISQWSPGVNEGQPRCFSDNVYLIQHGTDWMIWDTGIDDELIRIPEGKIMAHDVRGLVRRTLASQLAELGVAPEDVGVLAVSHAHFDHVGNSRLFTGARWYVQRREYDAMFGANFASYGFLPDLYASLRSNETVKIDGDFDVFGDDSVRILSTPGHTPGHQSLLVRLPTAGPVVLSGDVAHFGDNFRQRRVPKFNADHAASVTSMQRLDDIVDAEQAQLLINHDAAQSATIRCAPFSIR